MANSRTANSVRNIIWAVLQKVILMLLPFAVRTAMIYRLGAEYTGLGSLFNSILNVLSLAELGFSSAMVYCMYEPIHNGDEETICALLNFYKKIYEIIGVVILLAGLLVIPFLPKLINSRFPAGVNLYLLYAIYLTNTVISYFLFAYKSSLLTAYQRNDIISMILLVCNVCLYGVQICALLVTANFYLYAGLSIVSTIAINVSYEVASRTLYPSIQCRGEIDPEVKQKIKKRVVGIMLYKLSSTTRTSFDSIIISSVLGLVTLTQYQNYFMIISSVSGILSMVNTAVTASVGDSIVARSVDSNYKDFKKIVFMYMWIAGWCTICIACLIQPFMRLWMGVELLLPQSMALLFAVYFYTQTMGDTVYLYRTAAGLWWQDRARPVVEAVANILLNILLVKVLGLFGVILATVITLIAINFFWGAAILFRHYFHRSAGEYIAIQGSFAVVVVLAGLVSIAFCQAVSIGGVGQLLFNLGVCVIAPNLVFLVLYRKNPLYLEAKAFTVNIAGTVCGKLKFRWLRKRDG